VKGPCKRFVRRHHPHATGMASRRCHVSRERPGAYAERPLVTGIRVTFRAGSAGGPGGHREDWRGTGWNPDVLVRRRSGSNRCPRRRVRARSHEAMGRREPDDRRRRAAGLVGDDRRRVAADAVVRHSARRAGRHGMRTAVRGRRACGEEGGRGHVASEAGLDQVVGRPSAVGAQRYRPGLRPGGPSTSGARPTGPGDDRSPAADGQEPVAAARLALSTLVVSSTPGTFVIADDPRAHRLVVHSLSDGPTLMERVVSR